MDKRALCAFDTKRFLLDNGCDTMAYGHKDITHDVAQDQIENSGGDIILSAKEARDSGLLWSRRLGALKRLGFTPDDNGEETEREALAAGKELRAHMRICLDDVAEEPDILIPQELRPGAPRKAAKRPRMRIDSEEESQCGPITNAEEQREVSIQNSTSIQTSMSPTITKSLALYSGTKWAPSNKSTAVRSFFLEEAIESNNDGMDEDWPVRRHSSSPSLSHLESSDEDSEGDADSNDSFMVGDDIFD